MLGFTVISFLLLAGFIVLSGSLFGGIPGSYSAFSGEWARVAPKVNVWSVVTFLAAFTMFPPMVEAGDGSTFQFLGFFAPLYLIVVAFTPLWDVDRRQRIWHTVGAVLCAVLSLVWLIVIRGDFGIVAVNLIAGITAGLATRTLRGSLVFWGEIVMFASVYLSLFIS